MGTQARSPVMVKNQKVMILSSQMLINKSMFTGTVLLQQGTLKMTQAMSPVMLMVKKQKVMVLSGHWPINI